MRDIIILLLSAIPVGIAIAFNASSTIAFIAALPLLALSLVARLRIADSRQTSPVARTAALGVVVSLAIGGGLIALVLWYVFLQPSQGQ